MPAASTGSLSRAPTTASHPSAPERELPPNPSSPVPRRHALLERSQTWPAVRGGVLSEDSPNAIHKASESSPSAATPQPDQPHLHHRHHHHHQQPHSHEAFLDDLDTFPDHHFLAPIQMYEYEDWASDGEDDDAEEIEWDAGITDFALFDSDRRQAEESNAPLPSRWTSMLENQTSALQRALDRNRANPTVDSDEQSDRQQHYQQYLMVDDMPNLTPDNSPDLRDDFDVDSYHGQSEARPSVPNYLTIRLTPPDEDGLDADEESHPFFTGGVKQPHSQAKRRQQRPGLNHSRTMSGQVHAWRRPSRDMYTVGEEPDRERREEMCMVGEMDDLNDDDDDCDENRGRGRGRR